MAKKDTGNKAGDPTGDSPDRELRNAERNAASMEDIFGKDENVEVVKHADELDNQVLIITGFKRLTGGTGEYLFIYAFTPGESIKFGFTCGGSVVMEKLNKVQELGKFPVRCMFVSRTPKSGGKAYYDLAVAPPEK